MKTLLTLSLAALLVGCTPATPEEVKAGNEAFSKKLERNVKENTYDICIRGNSYLYFAGGNTSHTILLLDKDSKVIPCKEVEQ